MKRLIITFLVFVLFQVQAQIPSGYYDNAQGLTGVALKQALHDIIKNNHIPLSYSDVWLALKFTDEDPNNTNNVILLYTGWSYPKNNNGGSTTNWNREHTWAKSHGNFGTSLGPGTDIHHLRPTDVTVNSKRGNKHFDNGGNSYFDTTRYGMSGSFDTGCKFTNNTWEPRDEVKGDVARMIFYMAVRYEGDTDHNYPDLEVVDYIPSNNSLPLHGVLHTLLQWHRNDPVSSWEIRRNNRVYYGQGSNHDYAQWNRNPFIDHPEWVDAIWDPASAIISPDSISYTIYPNPAANNRITIQFTENNTGDFNVTVYDITGKQIQVKEVYLSNKIILSNLKTGIYLLKVSNKNTIAFNKLIVE